jgi:hypothetical protein
MASLDGRSPIGNAPRSIGWHRAVARRPQVSIEHGGGLDDKQAVLKG